MIAQTYPTVTSARNAYKAAYLAALAEAADPFIVGVIFAEKGESPDCSDIYTRDGDVAELREGYASVSQQPAAISQQPQLLAAGRIQGGQRITRGRALYDAREVVEHTVNRWRDGETMAEIRINDRLLFRKAFAGDDGELLATAWCNATAPLADVLDFPAAALAAQQEQEMIDAIFGPVNDEEPVAFCPDDEGSIEDDIDFNRWGC